jgi:hypothetical protein
LLSFWANNFIPQTGRKKKEAGRGQSKSLRPGNKKHYLIRRREVFFSQARGHLFFFLPAEAYILALWKLSRKRPGKES